MKPETIKTIDACFGRPICFLLTAIRKAAMLIYPRNRPRGPLQKILLLKLIEQGATVLAYDAIRRAVEMVGRQNVYFLVFADNREIIHILDIIPHENVFTIRSGNFFSFLADTWRALIWVRRRRIDAVVDMEFFSRASAILSFLTGAERRVGLHRFTSEAPYRGDLLTHRIQYNPYIHTSLAYCHLVLALATAGDETPLPKCPRASLRGDAPRFVPHAQDREAMKALLHENLGRTIPGPVILLNPNASDMLPIRKWPVRNFILLGRELLEAYSDAVIIITGAPSESEAAHDICRAIDSTRVFSLAGKTTLRQLLVLYTLADVLVTNDSGPAHFASLTEMDSVVLFGPETPALFSPIYGRSHVISANLACSPCVNAFNHRFSPCTNNICMQMISVREVFAAVKSRLAERQKNSENRPSPASDLYE